MTMDPSNPCLMKQKVKIGLNPRVLTYDTYPIRMTKPKVGNPYDDGKLDWLAAFDAKLWKFTQILIRSSKVRIVLRTDPTWKQTDGYRRYQAVAVKNAAKYADLFLPGIK